MKVVLDSAARRIEEGRTLIGGSPLRIYRLQERGRALIDQLVAGRPVPPDAASQRLVRRLLDSGAVEPRCQEGAQVESVTVVIPVKDDPAGLTRTRAALGHLPIIVVDDGSSTPVRGALRHDVSRGPGAARNTGWRATTTELVAFVDAGCEPTTGWLDRLLVHFGDPEVAAVAPRIASVTRRTPPALASYETLRSPLDMGTREGPVRPGSWVPYVPTATLVVRRTDLMAVDGFDEQMRFGEDVDLVWSLVANGRTVRYEPAAVVTHEARPTVRRWLRQRFDYGTSAAGLAERHGTAVAPLRISGWSALTWGLAGLGLRRSALAVAAVTTALLPRRLGALEHPWREGLRLAGTGHLHAGTQVADAVRRPWWPAALVAAVWSRRARRAMVLSSTFPLIMEWNDRRPALGLGQWMGYRLADDMAYGAGVWWGCLRHGSFRALVPDLTNWPGRTATESSAPVPPT